MRSPALLFAALAALAACGADRSVPGFAVVETEAGDAPPIDTFQFAADGTVYLSSARGLLRFDGTHFVDSGIVPPDATSGVRVEPDGTLYAGPWESTDGGATWTSLDLPGTGALRGVYGPRSAQLAREAPDADSEQWFHRADGGPWTPLGGRLPTTRPVRGLDGSMWIETANHDLYVIRGGERVYVGRSRALLGIGADGTRYYGTDALLEGTEYGRIIAVDEDGEEQVIARGDCVAAATDCPKVTGSTPTFVRWGTRSNLHLAGDGAFYQLWRGDNALSPIIVLRLGAGESSWRPVADAYAVYAAGAGYVGIQAAPNGDLWGFTNDQVGAIDEDSWWNSLYGYAFRVPPQ